MPVVPFVRSSSRQQYKEGLEGVKWELGFAYFRTGKMGFTALGLGKKKRIMGMGKMPYRVYRSFETLVKFLNA